MSSFCRPTLSVIIPVHNGGTKFRRCLQNLEASNLAPQEVIVVSDGDSDGSWQVAERFGAQVMRIPTPEGPARARNMGARIATGDILFFFDADVAIPQDALGRISGVFKDNPDLGALFGSYDDEPFESNFLSQYKNLFHHYVHQTAKAEASTFWSGCGAIRREIFLAIGGFEENYRRPSIEDIELGYRLRKAGHRICLLKDLQVKHLKRWEIFSLLKADFKYRALPWVDLILKEGNFIDDLNTTLSSRLSVICSFLLLASLLGAFWMPWLLIFTLTCMMGLLLINQDLYRFFGKKRGFGFTVKTIPWHWAYFFYSGLAFAFGFIKHCINRIRLGEKISAVYRKRSLTKKT
jgi:glycosyltransferase involved in cell wall biosynthesis